MDENNKIKSYVVPSIIVGFVLLLLGLVSWVSPTSLPEKEVLDDVEVAVVPDEVILPVRWGDLGQQLIAAGVLDAKKFEAVYAGRGGLALADQSLLYQVNTGPLVMTEDNSGVVLNLLWALGLGNKNKILEEGPMVNYDGQTPTTPLMVREKVGGFASTGGWTLSKGHAMDHYSQHRFINLSPDEQDLVERVSKNIYRPCCGNSTHFPDCNHGLAMLGLLELMATQGVSETEMYEVALKVNSLWFPDTYLTLAEYVKIQGGSWDEVDPKEMLSLAYSSSAGYQRILTEVTPVSSGGGGGCSV